MNKIEPIVSVIVPVYNVELYLKRCLDSIIKQTLANIEIILVDDGSTDNSGKICDEYLRVDSRIKVIHKKNGGLSSARNAGLDIASGKCVGFVDSDDWITDDFYEILYKLMKKNNADIVSCDYKIVHNELKKLHAKKTCKKNDICLYVDEKIGIQYLKSITKGGCTDASCCTKLYKKEAVDKIRFINGIIHEDVIFNWQIIKKATKYVKFNNGMYFYYMNNESITNDAFNEKNYDLIKVANMLKDDERYNQFPLYKYLMDQYEIKCHFSILIKMIKSKYNDAIKIKDEIEIVKINYRILIDSSLSLTRKIVVIIIKLLPIKLIYYYLKI